MRKLLLLLAVLFWASCSKTTDEPTRPTLSGTWNLIFTPSTGSSDTGTLTVVQQSDNKLTGNYVNSTNTHFAILAPSSSLSGRNVTLDWTFPATNTTLETTLHLEGTVNDAFTSINGTYYKQSPGYPKLTGVWLTNK